MSEIEQSPQAALARLRAWLVARYGLVQKGAKPQELWRSSDEHGVSTGYVAEALRIRTFVGRDAVWIRSFDVKLGNVGDARSALLDAHDLALLDRHFNYTPRPVPTPPVKAVS